MPIDPDKRRMRDLKRSVKRAGNKHRRRELKRDLAENPEGAAESEETFGGNSSAGFNGMDQDATRRRE
jgi:hypothetical protein